jgi:flagellar hook assembly protein FlgD
VSCDSPTSAEPALEVAGGVTLAPCQPNPFNPSTTISYGLPGPSAVNLEVFDVAGRLVRRLKNGTVESAGFHQVTWQGRDDRGNELGSGVYLYRLTVGKVVKTRAMTLVR